MTRTCNKCGEEKPLTEEFFRPNPTKGLRLGCRECENKAAALSRALNPEKAREAARKWSKEHPEQRNATKRAWYARNKDKHKDSVLKRMYGLPLEEYTRILTAQGGTCGICKTATEGNCGRQLSVDHNHSTGEVRGLLCGRCNSVLGFIDEHPGVLERAIEWLKR